MNTILLQKILDILTEGLAHVGNFFKDLFVSDPQDGQVISYDAEAGKWKNVDLTDISFDITHEAGPADSITITDAAADMPVKSLIVDIKPQQASGTPTPVDPIPVSGTSTVSFTHTYGDNETETITVNLGITVIGGVIDLATGHGNLTDGIIDLGSLTWTLVDTQDGITRFLAQVSGMKEQSVRTMDINCTCFVCNKTSQAYLDNSIYNVNNRDQIVVATSLYNDKDVFKAAMSGMNASYKLATSTPITITPNRIKTHGGTESFTIDANEFEMEYYTDTAGTIKSLVSITEDITSEVTANTTDWSDLMYKVVKNNNVVTIYIYSATTTEHGSTELFSGLPRAAYNGPVLLFDTDNNAVVNAKIDTSGYLDVTLASGGTVKGTITYVAK